MRRCYDGRAFILKFGLKPDINTRRHYISGLFLGFIKSKGILAVVGHDNCLQSVTITPSRM